jgi:transcriptional regulator with XRE-family HTH domain
MKKEALRQILADNVARRMEAAKLNQPELARKADIGQSHVSRILSGNQSIGLDVVAAVASALGCYPFELLVDSEQIRRDAVERVLSAPSGAPANDGAILIAASRRRRKPTKGRS